MIVNIDKAAKHEATIVATIFCHCTYHIAGNFAGPNFCKNPFFPQIFMALVFAFRQHVVYSVLYLQLQTSYESLSLCLT